MLRAALFFVVFGGVNGFLAYRDHYNLLLPFVVCTVLFLIFRAWARRQKWKKNHWLATASAIIGLFLAWAVLEAGLRTTKIMATYLEKVGQPWHSPYGKPEAYRKWFHVWTPNTTFPAGRSEFNYLKKVNREGLVDTVDYPWEKPDSLTRIVTLGDSFTEGVGAPQDSAWPQTLGRLLRDSFPRGVQVMNCGVSGSDPVYEYILLKERLLRYHPDKVIMMINNSDVDDIIARGGMERFMPDSVVHFRSAPWFEPIYRTSYVFRLGLYLSGRGDHLYLSREERKAAEAAAINTIVETAVTTKNLCQAHDCAFLLVFQPMMHETKNHKYDFLESLFPVVAQKNIDYLDLLECFKAYGDMSGNDIIRFGWPIDRHYNAEGYERIATCLVPFCAKK